MKTCRHYLSICLLVGWYTTWTRHTNKHTLLSSFTWKRIGNSDWFDKRNNRRHIRFAFQILAKLHIYRYINLFIDVFCCLTYQIRIFYRESISNPIYPTPPMDWMKIEYHYECSNLTVNNLAEIINQPIFFDFYRFVWCVQMTHEIQYGSLFVCYSDWETRSNGVHKQNNKNKWQHYSNTHSREWSFLNLQV